MMELLWLLLPVAAASGWWVARQEYSARRGKHAQVADPIRGIDYILDDKPDQAIEVLVGMTEVNRDTAETHLVLGNLFRRRGEVGRAIHIHRKLVSEAALSAHLRNRAMLELGEDYLRAGLFDRAESLLKKLAGEFEYAALALVRLVDIYEQQKDWYQAIACCDRLEHLTGQSRKAQVSHLYCEMAEQALSRDDRQEAQRCLEKALERNTNCVRASILKGRIAIESKHYEAAITALEMVEHQNRCYFPEVIQSLHRCYAALGQEDRLIDYLRRVHEHDHSGPITAALAELLIQREGAEAALNFLETELHCYPTILGMHRLVGLKLERISESNQTDLETLYRISRHLLNDGARYKCVNCGFIGRTLHWRCPSCKQWDSNKPINNLIAGG